MIGLGWLTNLVLGVVPAVDGLACTPGAGLTVSLAPGAVYASDTVDATGYGSLGTDDHAVLKQGLLYSTASLSVAAPTTAGQSIDYLVEVQYQDVDGGSTLLNYFDAANPSVPYSGPANDGVSQNTIRQGVCAVQVKAGTPAATGSQAPPAADSGWTGLYVVTVAFGQTTISSGNISTVGTAPFLAYKLGQSVATGMVLANLSGSAGPMIPTPFADFSKGLQSGGQQVVTASATMGSGATSPGNNIVLDPTAAGMVLTFGTDTGTYWLSNTSAFQITLSFAGGGGTDFRTTLFPGEQVALSGDGGGFFRIIAAANLLFGVTQAQNDNSTRFATTAYADRAAEALAPYAVDSSGANNIMIATPTPALAAYFPGYKITVKAANTNTGNIGLNVSGLGGVTIQYNGRSLSGGAIVAGDVYIFVHDGSVFQLINPTLQIISGSSTVAALNAAYPPASFSGYRAVVTDSSNTATFAAVAAGGGSSTFPVISNGTAWILG
jgi:hypothetical protein